MIVLKKFGYDHVSFEGSSKAINTFTRIHGKLSSRGYGVVLPKEDDQEIRVGMPGVGEVQVYRKSTGKMEIFCQVDFCYGVILSWLRNIFSRS